MSRLGVARLLATGAAVSTATVLRTGVRCLVIVARDVPAVGRLAIDAARDGGDVGATAALRDELLGVFRRTAEASWQELRRGVDDLDVLTRDDAEGAPRRPHRVKP